MARLFICKTARCSDIGHVFIRATNCPLDKGTLNLYLKQLQNANWSDNYACGINWHALRKEVTQGSQNSGNRKGFDTVLLITDTAPDNVKSILNSKLTLLENEILNTKNWVDTNQSIWKTSPLMNSWQDTYNMGKLVIKKNTPKYKYRTYLMKTLIVCSIAATCLAFLPNFGKNIVNFGKKIINHNQRPLTRKQNPPINRKIKLTYNPYKNISRDDKSTIIQLFGYIDKKNEIARKKYTRAIKKHLKKFAEIYNTIVEAKKLYRKAKKIDYACIPIFIRKLYEDGYITKEISTTITKKTDETRPYFDNNDVLIAGKLAKLFKTDSWLYIWLKKHRKNNKDLNKILRKIPSNKSLQDNDIKLILEIAKTEIENDYKTLTQKQINILQPYYNLFNKFIQPSQSKGLKGNNRLLYKLLQAMQIQKIMRGITR